MFLILKLINFARRLCRNNDKGGLAVIMLSCLNENLIADIEPDLNTCGKAVILYSHVIRRMRLYLHRKRTCTYEQAAPNKEQHLNSNTCRHIVP